MTTATPTSLATTTTTDVRPSPSPSSTTSHPIPPLQSSSSSASPSSGAAEGEEPSSALQQHKSSHQQQQQQQQQIQHHQKRLGKSLGTGRTNSVSSSSGNRKVTTSGGVAVAAESGDANRPSTPVTAKATSDAECPIETPDDEDGRDVVSPLTSSSILSTSLPARPNSAAGRVSQSPHQTFPHEQNQHQHHHHPHQRNVRKMASVDSVRMSRNGSSAGGGYGTANAGGLGNCGNTKFRNWASGNVIGSDGFIHGGRKQQHHHQQMLPVNGGEHPPGIGVVMPMSMIPMHSGSPQQHHQQYSSPTPPPASPLHGRMGGPPLLQHQHQQQQQQHQNPHHPSNRSPPQHVQHQQQRFQKQSDPNSSNSAYPNNNNNNNTVLHHQQQTQQQQPYFHPHGGMPVAPNTYPSHSAPHPHMHPQAMPAPMPPNFVQQQQQQQPIITMQPYPHPPPPPPPAPHPASVSTTGVNGTYPTQHHHQSPYTNNAAGSVSGAPPARVYAAAYNGQGGWIPVGAGVDGQAQHLGYNAAQGNTAGGVGWQHGGHSGAGGGKKRNRMDYGSATASASGNTNTNTVSGGAAVATAKTVNGDSGDFKNGSCNAPVDVDEVTEKEQVVGAGDESRKGGPEEAGVGDGTGITTEGDAPEAVKVEENTETGEQGDGAMEEETEGGTTAPAVATTTEISTTPTPTTQRTRSQQYGPRSQSALGSSESSSSGRRFPLPVATSSTSPSSTGYQRRQSSASSSSASKTHSGKSGILAGRGRSYTQPLPMMPAHVGAYPPGAMYGFPPGAIGIYSPVIYGGHPQQAFSMIPAQSFQQHHFQHPQHYQHADPNAGQTGQEMYMQHHHYQHQQQQHAQHHHFPQHGQHQQHLAGPAVPVSVQVGMGVPVPDGSYHGHVPVQHQHHPSVIDPQSQYHQMIPVHVYDPLHHHQHQHHHQQSYMPPPMWMVPHGFVAQAPGTPVGAPVHAVPAPQPLTPPIGIVAGGVPVPVPLVPAGVPVVVPGVNAGVVVPVGTVGASVGTVAAGVEELAANDDAGAEEGSDRKGNGDEAGGDVGDSEPTTTSSSLPVPATPVSRHHGSSVSASATPAVPSTPVSVPVTSSSAPASAAGGSTTMNGRPAKPVLQQHVHVPVHPLPPKPQPSTKAKRSPSSLGGSPVGAGLPTLPSVKRMPSLSNAKEAIASGGEVDNGSCAVAVSSSMVEAGDVKSPSVSKVMRTASKSGTQQNGAAGGKLSVDVAAAVLSSTAKPSGGSPRTKKNGGKSVPVVVDEKSPVNGKGGDGGLESGGSGRKVNGPLKHGKGGSTASTSSSSSVSATPSAEQSVVNGGSGQKQQQQQPPQQQQQQQPPQQPPTPQTPGTMSVLSSGILAPPGPYARAGDLYMFSLRRVPEGLAHVVERVFGFGKDQSPWRFFERTGSSLFAIGTSSSDLRRHILIPSSLFSNVHKMLLEDLRTESKDPTFDLKPFFDEELSAQMVYNGAADDSDMNSGFTDVIGIQMRSEDDYSMYVKALEKHTKGLRKKEKEAREVERVARCLERARDIVRKKGKAAVEDCYFVSVDVEAYEHDHDKILEIGWILYDPSHSNVLITKHYVVSENKDVKNGRYVPDNRDKFGFGQTETKSLDEIIVELKASLRWGSLASAGVVGRDVSSKPRPLVLVGHAVSGDIQWLRDCGVHFLSTSMAKVSADGSIDDDELVELMINGATIDKHEEEEAAAAAAAGSTDPWVYAVFDTVDLDVALRGRQSGQKTSLTALCSAYGVGKNAKGPFHNAGNDAFYTMMIFLEMTMEKGVP
ncbi:hypothetical protein HDU76_013936, partial [Blyttiomyces sp. JEL0837]